MDGSTVYSNEPEVNADIRAFDGGLMKTLPVFRDLGLMVVTYTYFNVTIGYYAISGLATPSNC